MVGDGFKACGDGGEKSSPHSCQPKRQWSDDREDWTSYPVTECVRLANCRDALRIVMLSFPASERTDKGKAGFPFSALRVLTARASVLPEIILFFNHSKGSYKGEPLRLRPGL